MKTITTLTAEQAAMIPVIRDQWLKIGLDCAPFEKGRAEAAVKQAYRSAGLKEPSIIIHLDSPMRGSIGAALLDRVWAQVGAQVRAQVRDPVGAQVEAQVWAQVGAQVRAQVRAQVWDQVWAQVGAQVEAQVWAQVGDQVWDQVGAQVRAQVGDQVRAQVGDQVGAQVGDQVWDQVEAQVWDQVWAQVGDQVWDQVRAQVGDQVGAQVYRASYGQYDAGWLSFYDFFSKATGLKSCDKLNGLFETAKECGWWWPFENAVIITPKAKVVNRDDRGRLHCENGPAIVYPDGWGIWAIHGVRVQQRIIEQPATITVAEIEAEQNAEIRRVMMDRYGNARYLVDSGAIQIGYDDYGTLYRKDVPNDEPLVMVKVLNSTPEPDGTFKNYWLRVDPKCQTAREAVAWSFDMSEQAYAPVEET